MDKSAGRGSSNGGTEEGCSRVKRFTARQVFLAAQHAKDGGQALHVWTGRAVKTRPACFREGEPWAHLLDLDLARLVHTAQRLGVRKVVVHGKGTWKQHVDLCGKPLQRALAECG